MKATGLRIPTQMEVQRSASLSESDLLVVGIRTAPAARARASDKAKFLTLPSRKVLAILQETEGAQTRDDACTLKQLARDELAGLEPHVRAGVLEFVIRATSEVRERRGRGGRNRAVRLSSSLHALREALRERLPVGLTEGAPMALIDSISRIDRDAYFIRGRIGTGVSDLSRLTAVSPEGSRAEVLPCAFWYELRTASPAIEGETAWKGFAVLITGTPSFRPSGWILELETKSGAQLEVSAPPVTTAPANVVREVLEDLAVERLPETKLRRTQVLPALRRFQRGRLRDIEVETLLQFGAPPASPEVSIVVPLYRRVDLLEHQLVHFADDPELWAADLIYVLDSPELEDQVRESARRLFGLYRQPFRLAVLNANGGFATANNLGASIARGRLLLLLNSDVLPEAPGWLGRMLRFHDSISNVGAVGPQLLYEDDTLQHAGMFFERPQGTHLWNNEHYFKGMHRDLPAAAESRAVPAITGACLMITRSLYRQLGGLSRDYVQGDFEDSDLCLRLLEAGRQNWYFAGAALYHLEAASYDPNRRRLNDGFNRWLQTHRWGRRLEQLGETATAPPRPTVSLTPEVEDELAAASPA